MRHSKHFDTPYIIKHEADNWDWPESFEGIGSCDQEGRFCIHSNGKTAAENGYTTHRAYPAFILKYCPNAPDTNFTELTALKSSNGPSGKHYHPVDERFI